MLLDGLSGPGDDRPARQVVQRPLAGLTLHRLEHICLLPVLMHEHDRLRRALLAGVGEAVVIGLPADPVDVLLPLRHVGAKNLPVVAAIFEPDFAIQRLDEMVTNFRAASKDGQPGVALLENPLHHRAVAVHKVDVLVREAAVLQQPDELLVWPRAALVGLNDRFVAHEERSHQLQHADLEREVERSD